MTCTYCKSMMHLKDTGKKWKEYICPKCKSFATESIEKQTRGADEPMTIIAQCLECDYNFRM
jgi:DNA-directed RNA polymerase subunit M/transcription elongation factor TFIIS